MKKSIITLIALLPTSAFAQFQAAQDRLDSTGLATESGISFTTLFGRAISAIISVLGIVFLIQLLYAGIIYVTNQGGDEARINKAKSTIRQATIGIIIIISAVAISTFISSLFNEVMNPEPTIEEPIEAE